MGDDDDDDDDAAGWTVQQPSKGFTSSLLNFSRGVDDFHVPYMCTYVRTFFFFGRYGLLVVMEVDERSDRGAKGSQARTKAEAGLCAPAACCHQTTDQLGVYGWWHLRMSCDLFSPSRATGIRQNPSPRHICFCVVRRDRDGDAVISGLDFSSTSTQLTSLPLSFFFFFVSVYLAICLCRGERELQKGLKCHGSGSGRREGVEGGRERERERERSCLPCSLGDSALASLQFTCTGLPKAAASQATVPKLASHWMGGALLVPRAAQRRSIGL